MAHYAFLDENNIVTQVIVGRNEDEVVDGISDWESYYSEIVGQRCLRTSYNNNIRKKYASIGDTYNEIADVFISPKPYASWSLNENYDWVAPVPKPENDILHYWSESEQNWITDVPVEPTLSTSDSRTPITVLKV
jgi:hypothetical protein